MLSKKKKNIEKHRKDLRKLELDDFFYLIDLNVIR